MPRPTSATTLQRPDLAGPLYEYYTSTDQFIGLNILPLFPVTEQSADYPVIPKEALLECPNIQRAARANYARSDFEFESDTYACLEYGFEEPVDETEAKLYARFFDAELLASQRATGILLRNQEKRIADLLFNASTFSGYTAGVTHEWDDTANATPAADVKAARKAIKDATGLIADTLVINWDVRENLNLNEDLIDRIKYTNPNVDRFNLPDALVAQALGVRRILVGSATYNSAKEGQTATVSNLWSGEYALLCVTSTSPSIKDPCLGRTFLWTADSPSNLVVEQYHEDRTRSDVYRVRHYVDEELILTPCGYLLSNITT